MEYSEAVEKLESIARDCHCGIIKEYGTFHGYPVFCIRRANLRPGGKYGLPRLYSYNEDGVYQLSIDEVLYFLGTDSFKKGGIVIKEIDI